MAVVTLKINGMSCGHCVKSVDGALKGLPGVTKAEVAIGSAVVEYEPGQVDVAKLKEAVEEEGYDVVGAQ